MMTYWKRQFKKVADESGIAIRTVFRQFADLETLTCKAIK